MALIKYSNDALGFITTLILARLLAPEDFGLVAVAGMVIEALRIFKDLGLSQALIYRQDDIERASHTMFLMVVGLNICVFICAVLISPLAGMFFDTPSVIPVIAVMASNLVWTSVRAVPDALLNKSLSFNKLVVPELVPVMLGSAISIGMAYQGYGVWSLVVRSLIISLGGMILIWPYTSYRPSFCFDKAVAQELMQYGRHIVGSSVMLVVLYNIDKFFISKFVGLGALGVYAMACTIANLPITQFAHIVCRLMFPVFSRMNGDGDVLRKAFLQTFKYTACITFPMALGISIYGPDAIAVAYGEKWAGTGLSLQILAGYAFFRSLSVVIHEMFKGTGHPELMQFFIIVRLCFISLLGIPSLVWFGLPGLCVLIAGTYGLVFVLEVRKVWGDLKLLPGDFIRTLGLPLIVSAGLIPTIYWVVRINSAAMDLPHLVLGIVITVLFYALSVFTFDKVIVSDIKKILFRAT